MKNLFKKYKHIIPVLIYMPIYLVWFALIEKTNQSGYTIIHTALDDKIPFIEVFVIPYFLWFGYVAVCVAIAFFTDKKEYYRSLWFLMSGMTVFLLVSTIWPNGQQLRPKVMPRDNIFTAMISILYKTDTPTNLWPSIHVYNSIGAHLCIANCSYTKNKKVVTTCSLILCISIIFSTMFIKQHSTFDVMTAFIMAGIMSVLVYRDNLSAYFKSLTAKKHSEKRVVLK